MEREQARARQPDLVGTTERDGVDLAYAVYGSGSPTVLLMPTWTIVDSRFWKAQVAYLARHYRVVTFDGRGTGRSGRPLGAAAYSNTEHANDAAIAMYQGFGFRPAGTRPRYYHDNGEDALIMWLEPAPVSA